MKKRNMAALALLAVMLLTACGRAADTVVTQEEIVVPEMSSEELLVNSLEYLLEEEPEEEPGQETASGNDLSVSGNDSAAGGDVNVFPEDYDLSAPEGELPDTESIVQAVEKQGDIMTAGFTCTCFMLGVLAGALVITGFRVRRV